MHNLRQNVRSETLDSRNMEYSRHTNETDTKPTIERTNNYIAHFGQDFVVMGSGLSRLRGVTEVFERILGLTLCSLYQYGNCF